MDFCSSQWKWSCMRPQWGPWILLVIINLNIDCRTGSVCAWKSHMLGVILRKLVEMIDGFFKLWHVIASTYLDVSGCSRIWAAMADGASCSISMLYLAQWINNVFSFTGISSFSFIKYGTHCSCFYSLASSSSRNEEFLQVQKLFRRWSHSREISCEGWSPRKSKHLQ